MDIQGLAGTFVESADTLVDDFDVLDLLYMLTSRCVELLGGTAAGSQLTDAEGNLRVAAASSESARLLERFQLQNEEGPCYDCYQSGEPVVTERLDYAQTRWPRFASAAQAEGFVAVLALPMRLRGTVFGALNLFGDAQTPPVDEAEIPIAQALADAAPSAILQLRLARSRDLLAEQLQVALESRVAVEQAKGTARRWPGRSVRADSRPRPRQPPPAGRRGQRGGAHPLRRGLGPVPPQPQAHGPAVLSRRFVACGPTPVVPPGVE